MTVPQSSSPEPEPEPEPPPKQGARQPWAATRARASQGRGRSGPARLRATQWPMVLSLAVLWVLLWGTVTVANVLTGLLVGVLVCLIFPLPPIDTQVRLHPVGMVRLVLRCGVDMAVSSWRINRHILAPGPPACALLRVRLRCPGDLLLTATAVAVSAIPGSTVLEVHRATGTLYLHVMGARHEYERERARHEVLRLERRVVRAFGTRADIALIRNAELSGAADIGTDAPRGMSGGGQEQR